MLAICIDNHPGNSDGINDCSFEITKGISLSNIIALAENKGLTDVCRVLLIENDQVVKTYTAKECFNLPFPH